ncbi:MAG: YidH family protein [Kosmotogaceae bacterium]
MEEKKPIQKEAEKRTYLANERTILANERTFSAWVRTGLASVVAGLGIVKFIDDFSSISHLLAVIIGVTFVGLGTFLYIIAFWRYVSVYRETRTSVGKNTPLWILTIVLVILLFASFITMILIFY